MEGPSPVMTVNPKSPSTPTSTESAKQHVYAELVDIIDGYNTYFERRGMGAAIEALGPYRVIGSEMILWTLGSSHYHRLLKFYPLGCLLITKLETYVFGAGAGAAVNDDEIQISIDEMRHRLRVEKCTHSLDRSEEGDTDQKGEKVKSDILVAGMMQSDASTLLGLEVRVCNDVSSSDGDRQHGTILSHIEMSTENDIINNEAYAPINDVYSSLSSPKNPTYPSIGIPQKSETTFTPLSLSPILTSPMHCLYESKLTPLDELDMAAFLPHVHLKKWAIPVVLYSVDKRFLNLDWSVSRLCAANLQLNNSVNRLTYLGLKMVDKYEDQEQVPTGGSVYTYMDVLQVQTPLHIPSYCQKTVLDTLHCPLASNILGGDTNNDSEENWDRDTMSVTSLLEAILGHPIGARNDTSPPINVFAKFALHWDKGICDLHGTAEQLQIQEISSPLSRGPFINLFIKWEISPRPSSKSLPTHHLPILPALALSCCGPQIKTAAVIIQAGGQNVFTHSTHADIDQLEKVISLLNMEKNEKDLGHFELSTRAKGTQSPARLFDETARFVERELHNSTHSVDRSGLITDISRSQIGPSESPIVNPSGGDDQSEVKSHRKEKRKETQSSEGPLGFSDRLCVFILKNCKNLREAQLVIRLIFDSFEGIRHTSHSGILCSYMDSLLKTSDLESHELDVSSDDDNCTSYNDRPLLPYLQRNAKTLTLAAGMRLATQLCQFKRYGMGSVDENDGVRQWRAWKEKQSQILRIGQLLSELLYDKCCSDLLDILNKEDLFVSGDSSSQLLDWYMPKVAGSAEVSLNSVERLRRLTNVCEYILLSEKAHVTKESQREVMRKTLHYYSENPSDRYPIIILPLRNYTSRSVVDSWISNYVPAELYFQRAGLTVELKRFEGGNDIFLKCNNGVDDHRFVCDEDVNEYEPEVSPLMVSRINEEAMSGCLTFGDHLPVSLFRTMFCQSTYKNDKPWEDMSTMRRNAETGDNCENDSFTKDNKEGESSHKDNKEGESFLQTLSDNTSGTRSSKLNAFHPHEHVQYSVSVYQRHKMH